MAIIVIIIEIIAIPIPQIRTLRPKLNKNKLSHFWSESGLEAIIFRL